MKNKQIQKKIKKSFFVVYAVLLIFAAFGVTTAAADTSVAWTKDIGDVTAADLSEDGSIIYAAIADGADSTLYVYDSQGTQQNTFSISGAVQEIVCTADGSKAALYTDGNDVYYIDDGQITWTEQFTDITDIDISDVGNVLIVESGIFHKYLSNGNLDYNSSAGTFDLGVIDPNDDYAIVQSGTSKLDKYVITTTDDYWGLNNYNSFNTNFADFQNLLILYTNPSQTEAIILSNATLGDELWEQVYDYIAVSDSSLNTTDAYNYLDTFGHTWTQQTASAGWSARSAACSWVVGEKLFIGAGISGSSNLRDVWMSEDFGQTWTQQTASAGWSARGYACSWVVGEKLFIGAGISGSSNLRDVWMSEDFGQTWTQQTASAGWSARRYACSWVVGEKLFIGAGVSSSILNDVWVSEDFGQTWTQQTASAGWSARTWTSTWVVGEKLFIGAGVSGSSNLNDVWVSEDFGQTWTQQTASAGWSARGYACSWVVGETLFIGGGYSSSSLNDVWMSEDFGQTWTQQTASAGWSARALPCSWVVGEKVFIGGGASGSNFFRDVWVSEEKSLHIQPSSTGQTYVFYSYTGSNPQHTQTTYNNAVDFSGTYELRTKPTLSIYEYQASKTYTGAIESISISDAGDWLGTATASRVYHDQITSSGFGTSYNAVLGSEGTVYEIATANEAAMSVIGQGQYTDIYSQIAARVGTYTAGGDVRHVDIAGNALWATSGGSDGKVYIFSKDQSSNWYLEYSSESGNPITTLKMATSGSYILAGRSDGLTFYQQTSPSPEPSGSEFWFTLYAYKDSDSYRNAAVNVSVYSGNQWNFLTQGLTDSAGKYVVQLTAGQNYKFEIGNGEKILIYMASPSVTSQTVSIYSSPISTSIEYNAVWDSSTNSINFNYTDTSAQTEAVTVKIVRTDNWGTVYDQTFNNQQTIQQSLPIIDDTTSYKVEFSVRRVSGVTRNTFIVSSSRDIIPIPLDQNIKNILFCGMLFVIAGLFSYLSAFRGPIVVSLVAGFFIYIGWVTIPWEWFVITIAVAIVASMSQRRS